MSTEKQTITFSATEIKLITSAFLSLKTPPTVLLLLPLS